MVAVVRPGGLPDGTRAARRCGDGDTRTGSKKKEPLRFMGDDVRAIPNPLKICVGGKTWLLIEAREVWSRPSSKSVSRSQPVGVDATVTSNTNPDALTLERLVPNPFEPYPGERFNVKGVKAGEVRSRTP